MLKSFENVQKYLQLIRGLPRLMSGFAAGTCAQRVCVCVCDTQRSVEACSVQCAAVQSVYALVDDDTTQHLLLANTLYSQSPPLTCTVRTTTCRVLVTYYA